MVDNYAEILETSLKVIFDLFLVFGIETFAEDEENKKKVSPDLVLPPLPHKSVVSPYLPYPTSQL